MRVSQVVDARRENGVRGEACPDVGIEIRVLTKRPRPRKAFCMRADELCRKAVTQYVGPNRVLDRDRALKYRFVINPLRNAAADLSCRREIGEAELRDELPRERGGDTECGALKVRPPGIDGDELRIVGDEIARGPIEDRQCRRERSMIAGNNEIEVAIAFGQEIRVRILGVVQINERWHDK